MSLSEKKGHLMVFGEVIDSRELTVKRDGVYAGGRRIFPPDGKSAEGRDSASGAVREKTREVVSD